MADADLAGPSPPPPLFLLLPHLQPRDLARCAPVSRAWRAAALAALAAGWSSLSLDGEPRSGAALRSLLAARHAWLPRLRSLSLVFARGLEDADVARLAAAAPGLQEATLDGAATLGDDAVAALAAHCPRLQALSLYWNVRLSGAPLLALAGSPCAARLSRLNLSGCKALCDAAVAALLAAAPRLRQLDLTRCLALSDATLRALAAAPCAPFLTQLVLYANNQFGSNALAGALRAAGGSLVRLDLCGIQGADDAALAALAAAGEDPASPLPLRTLNLSWCLQLSNASLLPLFGRTPQLRWLSLHGNRRLGGEVLEALAAGCGRLEALDVRGCTGAGEAAERAPAALRRRFPRLTQFALHS